MLTLLSGTPTRAAIKKWKSKQVKRKSSRYEKTRAPQPICCLSYLSIYRGAMANLEDIGTFFCYAYITALGASQI